MRTRLALCSAAASGALALGTLLTTPAAFAAPVSTECLKAQNAYNAAESTLQQANSLVAADRINGVPTSTLNTDIAAASQASVAADVARRAMNIQCGTTTGPGTGNGFPRPHPVPVPTPVGFPNGGYLNCNQLAARGLHDIPAGSAFYYLANDADRDGIACETGNNTTIPVGTFRVVNGQNCHWNGTAWIPVTVVAPPPAVDPCNCAPTPDPQPTQVIIRQQPPVVTQTVVEQPPVYVPPAQVFATPQAPSVGAVATGDGSLASVG